MKKNKQVLVITDDENSETIKILLRHKFVPLTRSSISSAIELLKHLLLLAVVIDKKHQKVDTLEFILNVRDLGNPIPILVPGQYMQNEEWNALKKLASISTYDAREKTLDKQLQKLIES